MLGIAGPQPPPVVVTCLHLVCANLHQCLGHLGNIPQNIPSSFYLELLINQLSEVLPDVGAHARNQGWIGFCPGWRILCRLVQVLKLSLVSLTSFPRSERAPSGIWITWCYHFARSMLSCLSLDFRPNLRENFYSPLSWLWSGHNFVSANQSSKVVNFCKWIADEFVVTFFRMQKEKSNLASCARNIDKNVIWFSFDLLTTRFWLEKWSDEL